MLNTIFQLILEGLTKKEKQNKEITYKKEILRPRTKQLIC